jgi:enoyl-CoA hydratase
VSDAVTPPTPPTRPTPPEEHLVVTDADGVRTIRLNRPEARNALSRAVRIGLKDVVADAGTDDTIDALVITGTDPAFSGGVDLKEIAAGTAGNAATSNEITDPAAVLRACPKPVIAAVNGVCVTGALELVLSCDLVVASERARFADTHGKVGFRPAWGMSVFLPRAVGARKAIEMAITGRFLEADDALRAGLVNHVVPHDELLPFTYALAADIRALDRDTVRDLLALFRRTPGLAVDDALVLERATVDAWMAGRRNPSERT